MGRIVSSSFVSSSSRSASWAIARQYVRTRDSEYSSHIAAPSAPRSPWTILVFVDSAFRGGERLAKRFPEETCIAADNTPITFKRASLAMRHRWAGIHGSQEDEGESLSHRRSGGRQDLPDS